MCPIDLGSFRVQYSRPRNLNERKSEQSQLAGMFGVCASETRLFHRNSSKGKMHFSSTKNAFNSQLFAIRTRRDAQVAFDFITLHRFGRNSHVSGI